MLTSGLSPNASRLSPLASRLSPPAYLSHREPDSREKLKARVVRVRGNFGPLVQYYSKAHGKHRRNPLAPLLARKIREGKIRHGMSHRVLKMQAETDSAHPGLCMPWMYDSVCGQRISMLEHAPLHPI